MHIDQRHGPDGALPPRVREALDAFAAARGSMDTVALPVPERPWTPTEEQLRCAQASGPATLVVAGAGCGKSSVVDMRLDALSAAGVEAASVLCLSFTNAAADHLRELHPGVQSQTVASWTKERFEGVAPGVALAPAETFANITQADPRLTRCADIVRQGTLGRRGAALSCVEEVTGDPDGILGALEEVGIADLVMQAAVVLAMNGRTGSGGISHVIVDEAQDNSAVDLLLVLSFCTAYGASLFIVGDACQSLYEFRDASPDTLLALASSGVFETLTLSTNFRSSPEVLRCANALLGVMESNRDSRIVLRCPEGTDTGSCSWVDYRHRRVHPLRKDVAGQVVRAAWEKATQTLAADGSVGLLAKTNAHADELAEAAREAWPWARVVRPGSPQKAPATVLSRYLAQFGDVVSLMEGPGLVPMVERHVIGHLGDLGCGEDRATASQVSAWASWAMSQGVSDMRGLTRSIAFFESSLSDETDGNPSVEEGPTVVCTTVHGAKGLEYDCVAVPLNALDTDEADLRCDYVALTRARRHLVAVGCVREPMAEEVGEAPLGSVRRACNSDDGDKGNR